MKSIYLRLAVVVAAVVLVASSGTARAQDGVRSGLRANVASRRPAHAGSSAKNPSAVFAPSVAG